MAKVLIIGNKGFYCGLIKTGNGKNTKMINSWSKNIKDAMFLNSKTAKNLLDNKIDGFIWYPFKENNIEKQYKVILIEHHDDNYNTTHYVWEAVRDYSNINNSDIDYLKRKGKALKKTYTKAEAEQIAINKNKEFLEKINNSIKEMIQKKANDFNL